MSRTTRLRRAFTTSVRAVLGGPAAPNLAAAGPFSFPCAFMPRPARLLAAVAAVGALTSPNPAAAQNLIVNGNFDAGYSGFASGYGYVSSGQSTSPGTFGIRTDTHSFNPGYGFFYDHTTGNGSGKMLLVDGVANTTAWQQTVNVAANTDYTFSFWAASSVFDHPSILRVLLDGGQIGSDLTLPPQRGDWQLFTYAFNSGASTSTTFSLYDVRAEGLGNDFAVDDISLVAVTPGGGSQVPEPGAWAALAGIASVGGLAVLRRRRK